MTGSIVPTSRDDSSQNRDLVTPSRSMEANSQVALFRELMGENSGNAKVAVGLAVTNDLLQKAEQIEWKDGEGRCKDCSAVFTSVHQGSLAASSSGTQFNTRAKTVDEITYQANGKICNTCNDIIKAISTSGQAANLDKRRSFPTCCEVVGSVVTAMALGIFLETLKKHAF